LNKNKKLIINIFLLLSSIILSIAAAEVLLRLYGPNSSLGVGPEIPWLSNATDNFKRVFTIDPHLGFRPILGNNFFNEYGTKVNRYDIKKRPNIKRLLFIGDSVTHRGKIIDGLKLIYGENRFEFWNAGVESFNTVQEVNFYKKYNKHINPDHVILTFSLNDFETTPIAFYDKNKLVVYAPDTRSKNINLYLFQHSHIYRLFLGTIIAIQGNSRETVEQEVHESLKELRDILAAEDIAFTVLVLPMIQSYYSWRKTDIDYRNKIIDILKQLEIRHFDLFYPLDKAIREGVKIQDNKSDIWHPSRELSFFFSEHLQKKQIF
jgi:hypothetical protein